MLTHEHPELLNAAYVVFVDSNRRYVDCTPGVSELFGYTREELLQKTAADISYDVASIPELFKRFLQNREQQGEYVFQRKDQTPLLVWYKAFVFHDRCMAAILEPIKDWREPYMAALLELEPQKQIKRIDAALEAISQSQSNDAIVQRALDASALLLKSMRKRLTQ